MNLTINGEPRAITQATTVVELLDELGIEGTVAIERNGAIVPRHQQTTMPIAAGDRLEIVQFVGGG